MSFADSVSSKNLPMTPRPCGTQHRSREWLRLCLSPCYDFPLIFELEAMCRHRYFPSAITTSLFLVLFLTESRSSGDDEILMGSGAVVIGRGNLLVVSIILQLRIHCFHHLVRVNPAERRVRLSLQFFAWRCYNNSWYRNSGHFRCLALFDWSVGVVGG